MLFSSRTPAVNSITALTVILLTAVVHCTPSLAVETGSDPVKSEPAISKEDRDFWSFKPLIRPALPKLSTPGKVRNPIDQFSQAHLEKSAQSLGPSASPQVLIRRVTYDLTGLPPTPDEVRDFEEACAAYDPTSPNPGPNPLEALADRLLASPRYGEKWAQSWLDLARFAETDGFEHDVERKLAWKYRDWVVSALNDDMPLNDFVAMQIAGDEIAPEHAAATDFLLACADMPESNFQDERRHLVLNDVASTVGNSMLGLTIGCAQCHNHPYDPISQADFYRLRAFFDNLPSFKKDQQLPAVMVEKGNAEPVSKVAIRGDHERPGPAVQAAVPRIADEPDQNTLAFASLPKSTGRRMALARWITRDDNRLFLRTTANRIWQLHFGEGLTSTPDDLGRQGAAPTNPELLDWLACEIPARKWSLKAIHKLIVTSSTYCQAGPNERSHSPAHSSFARRRLTGEELRDAMLFSAGLLEYRGGGPSVRIPLPSDQEKEKAVRTKSKSKTVARPTAEPDYRSIWVHAKRNEHPAIFELFDRPDALLSCNRRNQTTTAPQALTLFNSEFSHRVAKALAVKLLEDTDDPADLVQAATWRCFSRPPTKGEQTLGEKFLTEHGKFAANIEETLTDYCLALMNSNAFCFVD